MSMICIFISAYKAKSQDTQFSQFFNVPYMTNPSLTGAFNGSLRIQISYKDQWRSISNPYKSYSFFFDMGLRKKKGKTGFLGIGCSLLSDKAGTSRLGLTQANLSLAYHVKLSEYHSLSSGIIAGIAQRSIDYSTLQWNSQYDGNGFNPSLPTFETNYSDNKTYSDFGAGIEWTHIKGEQYSTANDQVFICAGVAAFHINQPEVSFYSTSIDDLPLKIILNGRSLIGISGTKYSIAPGILFVQQGAMKNLIIGSNVRMKLTEESKYTGFNKAASISFGGYCRIGDAVIPYVQLELNDYMLGLGYDFNTSGLIKATSGRGGFEISLRWINTASNTKNFISKIPGFYN